MKKTVIVGALSMGFLMLSCGSGSEEEGSKGSACKTGNGVEISCEDAEAYKQLGDLIDQFELTFPENKEEYNAFIATNEAVLNEIEPIWGSIENIVEADPGLKEQQPYSKTMNYKEDVAMYKAVLADLEKLTVSGGQEEGVFMITVKNGSANAIKEFRGYLQYLDAEGNVICENDYEFSAADFGMENGIPAGAEAKTEKGIYCKNKDQVSSASFEIQGLDYAE